MISLEYFLGSFLTVIFFYFLSKKMIKNETNIPKIINRQSDSFQARHRASRQKIQKESKITQSKKHYDKTNVRVLIMEDVAFWIKDNAVYSAPVENEEVIKNSAVQVDMIGMNKVELDKMMFIVDKLTERYGNDSRNSGF